MRQYVRPLWYPEYWQDGCCLSLLGPGTCKTSDKEGVLAKTDIFYRDPKYRQKIRGLEKVKFHVFKNIIIPEGGIHSTFESGGGGYFKSGNGYPWIHFLWNLTSFKGKKEKRYFKGFWRTKKKSGWSCSREEWAQIGSQKPPLDFSKGGIFKTNKSVEEQKNRGEFWKIWSYSPE